jgi:hypothetical protein
MIHFLCLWHAPDDDLAPQVDEYGIPENPYVQQEPPRTPPVRRSRVARNAAQPAVQSFEPEVQQPAAPQFGAPASPEIPDWLKIAQQNKTTSYARPQQPRVQTAPRPEQGVRRPVQRPVSPYEQAGYPQHLVEAQYQLEREQAAVPVRRRHGAQYAQPLPYQPEIPQQPTGMSYPPPRQVAPEAPAPMPRAYMHQPKPQQQEGWQVETDEEVLSRELPAWVRKVPWLGIAVSEEAKGCHLGTRLMEFAKNYALQHGKGGILLTTHRANIRGQALYEKSGYEYLGDHKSGELMYILDFKEE